MSASLLMNFPSRSQKAAKRLSDVTGGKLDCLIHNAARMEPVPVMKGFDD